MSMVGTNKSIMILVIPQWVQYGKDLYSLPYRTGTVPECRLSMQYIIDGRQISLGKFSRDRHKDPVEVLERSGLTTRF